MIGQESSRYINNFTTFSYVINRYKCTQMNLNACLMFQSKAKADFANKLLEVGNSEHVDAEKRLEIAREVMQELRPNKKGRPCGHGVGVTKSQVTKFSYELRRMRRQSVSSENRFLLNKVVAQSKEMEKQGRQMKMMEENMNKFLGQLKTVIPAFFATGTSNAQVYA